MKERLFIFDGTALAYRAHFALIKNPLINSKGQHTSALYGLINSFLRVYDEYKPEYVAITFDRKEKTFRHELAACYKATRPPMPDELISQIEAVKTFFELAGIGEISKAGFEADDIIGTLAKKFEDKFDVVIVSGDKDFAQLVNESISLYDHKNNKILNESDIIEKFEIKPSQFVDYLALVGDSSDNIPGAKGIGPKTAIKLLHEYNDIETLYERLHERPSTGEKEKLVNSKENVFLSKTLATIKTDVEIDNLEQKRLTFLPTNLSNTLEFLDDYELRNLKLKIDHRPQTTDIKEQLTVENEVKCKFTLIQNIEQLKGVISRCNSGIVSVDTETTSVNFMEAELVGISLCYSEEEAFYIPLTHLFAENLDIDTTLDLLKEFLADKIIVGHNLKYDNQVLGKYDFEIARNGNYDRIFDTMLAAYLLDPGKIYYSLEDCAKREFDYKMIPISDLIGKGKKQISFSAVEIEQACEYAAEDAFITFKLYHVYAKRLKDLSLSELYYNIEIPLIFTLSDMERYGVNIDVSELRKMNTEITLLLESLKDKIYDIAGEDFNINSTQQLSNILFDKLKIEPVKKTQTGYSTDVEVLEILAEKHEIAKLLIEYRHLSKMKNTYIEALPELVNPFTKRVHSSFNQTITSTGRLSCTHPNLQNIPIKTELGKKIRRAFSATGDKVIVSADYSQIELRVFAMLSKDESMIAAFREGVDIHTNTASAIFKKDNYKIDSSERRKAKVINFGIIYGMGAQSLSKELGISPKEGKDFIDNYFSHFPTIKSFIDRQKFNAHQNGWVETIYKRRLYLSDINNSNQRLNSEAERVAINMPIQGSAADIIKIAMNNIHSKINNRDDIKMLIQVHDELVFEVDNSCVEEAIELIRSEMETALMKEYREIVPMVVEIGHGKNWDEAK